MVGGGGGGGAKPIALLNCLPMGTVELPLVCPSETEKVW